MKIFAIVSLLVAVLPLQAAAEIAPLPAGQYITEHGWGRLVVKQPASGKLTFAIAAVGSNAHTCELDGEIRNGQAILEGDKTVKACVVKFTVKADGIQVDSNQVESCRYYCGMRAGFEGFYLKPAPGCDDTSRARARKEFKQLYDKKAYADALAKLEPVLQNCGRTLDWLDSGWVRNDLALTQYKLGNAAACLKLLEPLAKDAAMSEDELRNNYPPTDAESYLPIVKASRTNLKLCKAK